MARKTMLVSDLSGEPLDEANSARVVITIDGDRYDLDVKRKEIEHFLVVGRKTKVRGRKKQTKVVA